MQSVLAPLAKSVLIPLGLSKGMSAADASIQKKIYGSGHHLNLALRTTALTISNEGMEDIGFLIKGISETNKNEAKEQKMELLSKLLWILAASVLGNALVGKRVT